MTGLPAAAEMLAWLHCPSCRAPLRQEASGASGKSRLLCARGHGFRIDEGVPLFCPELGAFPGLARTARAFEARWRRFYPTPGYMTSWELLLDNIEPVTHDFFQGKEVLDAGCGAGRFSRLALEMGAKLVFGVDLFPVRPAAADLQRPAWHRIQANLHRLPFSRRFDYIMSLGVLHHLEDPAAGFQALAALLKPGGHISIWVYGKEDNAWILRWVDPLRRRLTSRLPGWALEAFCLLPAALLYAASRSGAGRGGLGLLSGSASMSRYCRNFLRRLGFRETVGVIYDHLAPPRAHYVAGDELRRWFRDNGLELLSLSSRNGNSWRAFGRRPPQ